MCMLEIYESSPPVHVWKFCVPGAFFRAHRLQPGVAQPSSASLDILEGSDAYVIRPFSEIVKHPSNFDNSMVGCGWC